MTLQFIQPVMTIDPPRGLVEFAMRGRTNADQMQAANDLFKASHLDFAFNGFVWDMREADLSGMDLSILAGSFARHPMTVRDRDGMRSAVVVKGAGGEGIGQLWASAGALVDKAERRVFDDIGAARDWVARSSRNSVASPVQVNRDAGIIQFKLIGEVNAEAILRFGRLYRDIPRDFHLRGFIWDFRKADLSTYDHREMARVFQSNPADFKPGGLRIATVALSTVERQLLALWERQAELYDRNERRSFRDMESASDWVAQNTGGIPPL